MLREINKTQKDNFKDYICEYLIAFMHVHHKLPSVSRGQEKHIRAHRTRVVDSCEPLHENHMLGTNSGAL